jgi:hypothetical protein
MSIVFRNKGAIDIASITTFGVSSKVGSGAIGFFGTGLKYAIAILLREGCAVTIHTGGQVLKFGTEQARIRVDNFTFVTMNGERLGFTTELGKTWELWCAFRELYCNCLDEKGEASEVDSSFTVGADETAVVVDGEKFFDIWARRSEIVLDKASIYDHEAVKVCAGASPHVFYRGIRAAQLSAPSRFTYNIQRRLDLTEDRTIKYDWDIGAAVQRAWMESNDEHLIEMVLTSPKGTYENGLTFTGVVPSEAFQNVVQRLRSTFTPFNHTAWEACRIWIMDKLHEAAPSKLSPVDQARLDKAINFCERIGFAVRDYPIRVSEFLGEDVLGRAHEGYIYVSKRVFMMGTKMLAGTLIEEFIHLRHRCDDNTRIMQNILMDTICGLGEQITGEPL